MRTKNRNGNVESQEFLADEDIISYKGTRRTKLDANCPKIPASMMTIINQPLDSVSRAA